MNEFSKVVASRKDIHLYLIGDGPDREALLAQCDQLNLNDYVTFLGNQENPFPYLAQMDGFALDSRYEGQGMVLWEAKAVGLTLFLPKRLEKYNAGLSGCGDMVEALSKARKAGRCGRGSLQIIIKLFLLAYGTFLRATYFIVILQCMERVKNDGYAKN